MFTAACKVSCPYCGEHFETVVDCSVDWQEYIEDCYVCCRPIIFSVTTDGDEPVVTVRAENETA